MHDSNICLSCYDCSFPFIVVVVVVFPFFFVFAFTSFFFNRPRLSDPMKVLRTIVMKVGRYSNMHVMCRICGDVYKDYYL